jgi:predicted TIM-barrel fold metal-dependent hydrolase
MPLDSPQQRSKIIAVEEHFWTPKIRDLYSGRHMLKSAERARKLVDLGETRIREMDEAGIDLQVLSLVQPGVQVFDAESAIALARENNDALHETIRSNPERFAGFAAIPTAEPKAAADELDRAVTEYGFKGAMVCGLTNGRFLDEKAYWCIFERAQALDVPIFLHPAIPHDLVIEAYFKDHPVLFGAAWGFAVETATHAARLILSGVFDAYPNLKIILGHFGEGLPFFSWRSDKVIGRSAGLNNRFKEYVQRNFYFTTSADFSYPAMMCCLLEVGADRVMFAVDWPYGSNGAAVDYIRRAPISEDDKQKIFHRNAQRILGIV